MVRDFIKNHAALWRGKKVLCLATMGLFSGDGAGCAARLLKKYGAEVVGGLHICMPDSIGDVKLLKKTVEKNRREKPENNPGRRPQNRNMCREDQTGEVS